MPIMLRPKISSKIAFSILGKPANIENKQSGLQKKISKVVLSESTKLAR